MIYRFGRKNSGSELTGGIKELAGLDLLAIIVGIICGSIAIGFRYLIFFFNDLFYYRNPLSVFHPYYVLLIPSLGGFLVGLLTYYLAPETKGHGVPEVMAAMAVHGGKIRSRVVGVKALASSICLGSGGSAGREGPIVQMGSAAGSAIAQRLGFSPYHTKVMVACGAAGGIAGTFNTPIAGALFSIELIMREVKIKSLVPIATASVFATLCSRILLQHMGARTTFIFEIPEYSLKSPWELLFYLLLGFSAGILATVFIHSLYKAEDIFNFIRLPEYLKPSLGGLIVGMMGLILIILTGKPYIFGVGYEVIESILHQKTALSLVLILVFLKVMATSFTLGSGGSGGVFAPSLFIGAMLGATHGILFNTLFPELTAGYEAYAIVGMAALFAGVSRAILTSIIIIFEMTGDYAIILPLMFSSVISSAICSFLVRDSIYTLKLSRRGIIVDQEMDVNLMRTIKVRDIMKRNVETVSEELSVDELLKKMMESGHMGFPVVDRDHRLVGIVTHNDIEKVTSSQAHVRDIMTTNLIVANPDDTLEEVLLKVGGRDVSHFPVVDPDDRRKLIGFLTKGDILRAYMKKKAEEYRR